MSYRDLRPCPGSHASPAPGLFAAACAYSQYLWLRDQPARAILALCRGLYLDPLQLGPGHDQPYPAYAWFLRQPRTNGFLGNPRASFARQATRIPASQVLKRHRAWALWHITVEFRADLPPDPAIPEQPLGRNKLHARLNAMGLPGEGDQFLLALEAG
jgi:hypothetical protein